jgi:ankyrin repeat protein
LHWAANYSHSEAVRLLLKEGANASACDARGDNPLHLAALSGSEGATPAEIDVIFNLLFNAQNVDIEAQNNYGNTPKPDTIGWTCPVAVAEVEISSMSSGTASR